MIRITVLLLIAQLIMPAASAMTPAERVAGFGQNSFIHTTNNAKRSAAAKRAFRALNPCPKTESTKGACPGWVIDHIRPLCAGGADHPSNMQWQSIEDGKAKDRLERRECPRKR